MKDQFDKERDGQSSDQLRLGLDVTGKAMPPQPGGGVTIHGNVIGQNVGIGGDATQIGSQAMTVFENMWRDLARELQDTGVPDEELITLRTAVESDLAVTDEKRGAATRRWFAELAKKVGAGIYSVGLDVVAALIKQHTGLTA